MKNLLKTTTIAFAFSMTLTSCDFFAKKTEAKETEGIKTDYQPLDSLQTDSTKTDSTTTAANYQP